jgi:hypothetical protein
LVVERRVEFGRIGVRAIAEWLVAAIVSLAVLAVLSLIAREFRSGTGLVPVIAREAPAPVPPTPAGVPSRAVSVPVLLLPEGKQLRVGETVSAVSVLLGAGKEAGEASVERGPNGDTVTRYYDDAGTRFVLVFEPFERNAEPRVAAIYLQ